jgi:hypothetical protein
VEGRAADGGDERRDPAVGALFLMPLEDWLKGWIGAAASAVQMFGLAVAFFAARWLALAKRFERWMQNRAEAELSRIALFDLVIDGEAEPRAGEVALLPLKLEYFRRYQLDVQAQLRGSRCRAWRGSLAQQSLARCKHASHLVLGALVALHVAAVWQLPIPAQPRSLSADLAGPHTNRLLLCLGVIASGLYGLGVARSLMDLDERAAAVDGSAQQARACVDRVHRLVSSEHQEWILLSSRERDPQKLRRVARR